MSAIDNNLAVLVSKENPTGISRKQHIVLKALQAAEQTSHGDEDWITSYRPGRDNHGNSFALNMFQSDSSPSPHITTPPLATPVNTRREDHLNHESIIVLRLLGQDHISRQLQLMQT